MLLNRFLRGLGDVFVVTPCTFGHSDLRAIGDVLEGHRCVLEEELSVMWFLSGRIQVDRHLILVYLRRLQELPVAVVDRPPAPGALTLGDALVLAKLRQ